MKLNVTKIRNAASRERAYRMADGRGLSLLIQPTGSKLWQWGYKDDTGRRRTASLGAFPEVSLDEARSRVTEGRKTLRLGEQPPTPVVTFRQAWQEHLRVWESGKKMTHIIRVKGRIEADALPTLGDRPLAEIKPTDVVAVVRAVEERGALDVARRLKQKIGEVFGYAIVMGWCDTDPAAHVNRVLRPKPATEHMARVPLSQMPELVVSLGRHPDRLVRLGLRLTLLTAVRSAEMRGARWSELTEDRWQIDGSRMKMGREHRVPLSKQAQELVAELRTLRRNEFLFPGPRRPQVNTNWMINGLYDLGWRDRMTVHGCRGVFSTWANESGWNADVIELCLAHVEGNKVRGAYNAAERWDDRVALMQAWADQIDAWTLEGMLE